MTLTVLALGQFDYSRHVLTALADRGLAVHYGYVRSPQFQPPARPNLAAFPIAGDTRAAGIAEAVDRVRPDVIFVGTASYDGSNRVVQDLLDLDTGVPVIRFYKEFVLKPSYAEQQVIRGVDGLVAGGKREALYFQAVYGIAADKVHVFDPDVISSDLIAEQSLQKLSALDGEPHVVLGGNLKSDDSEFDYRTLLRGLADCGVHVHVYALGFSRWLAPGRVLDPDSAQVRDAYADLWDHPYVHLETPVFGADQMLAWTQYDAGLTQRPSGIFRPELTPVQSMNLPSKYSYYLGSGLPIIVHTDALPSLRELLAGTGTLIEYADVAGLAKQLHDLNRLADMSTAARRIAPQHTAQAGMGPLLAFADRIRQRS